MKGRIFVIAVLAVCSLSTIADARGRLFGRRGGGGGGGSVQSINPHSLPASYPQAAMSVQQGAPCTGPNCPNPAFAAVTQPQQMVQQVQAPAAPLVNVTAKTQTVTPATVGSSIMMPIPSGGWAGPFKNIDEVNAWNAQQNAPKLQDTEATVVGREIGNAIASALGEKLGIKTVPDTKMADVVDSAPMFKLSLISPTGEVLKSAELSFADFFREQVGSK